jgi:hypothetical protein
MPANGTFQPFADLCANKGLSVARLVELAAAAVFVRVFSESVDDGDHRGLRTQKIARRFEMRTVWDRV